MEEMNPCRLRLLPPDCRRSPTVLINPHSSHTMSSFGKLLSFFCAAAIAVSYPLSYAACPCQAVEGLKNCAFSVELFAAHPALATVSMPSVRPTPAYCGSQ